MIQSGILFVPKNASKYIVFRTKISVCTTFYKEIFFYARLIRGELVKLEIISAGKAEKESRLT